MRLHAKVVFFIVILFFSIECLYAKSVEKALGLGVTFFSGAEKSYLAPPLSGQITFSANVLASSFVNFVNRFEIATLFGGVNFGGEYGTYSAYVGSYELAMRLNFGKENMQPYIEGGTLLGVFAVTLSSEPENESKNQTALKYGYILGTGFDWIKGEKRGEGGGWGLGFSYFKYMKSPAKFEFPVSSLEVQGVKFELRLIIPPAS